MHVLISYDLHKVREYKDLYDLLEGWGAVRLLESVWVVTRNDRIGVIRKAVSDTLDSDDSVAVVELKPGSGWASLRARAAGIGWLKKNIKDYG